MKTYSILPLKKIDSTNRYAREKITALSDRQVILAERQTNGCGRLNRKWISNAPGNIYMSLVLKPYRDAVKAASLVNLTQYTALVICDVLTLYGVKASIKWPNDVLVDGMKIAGILSESVIRGEQLTGFILGIGINLNMSREELKEIDRPAASLNLITGKPIDRDLFLEQLLKTFFSGYENYLESGFSFIRKSFIEKNAFIGKHITVISLQNSFSGTAKDIDHEGALILATETGKEMHITLGDIS